MNLIPWKRQHAIPVSRPWLFDRFYRGGLPEQAAWSEDFGLPAREFIPSIDVAENDKQITVRVELPGMDAQDVDINISGNVLTLHGEKRESAEDKGDDFYHCERCFGSFTRSVELPATADLEDVDAECCNGVLMIRVKKLPTAKSKKIDVKASRPMMAEA